MKSKITASGNIRVTMTPAQAMSLRALLNHSVFATYDGSGWRASYTIEDEKSMADPLFKALLEANVAAR